MKTFVLDIWADLREKRMWPVALVLLAALVAVPVVLSKPSEDPPAAPAASLGRAAGEPKDPGGLAAVKLGQDEGAPGSALDTFDPSDPFRPPAGVAENSSNTAGLGGEASVPAQSETVVDEAPVSTSGSTGGSGTGGAPPADSDATATPDAGGTGGGGTGGGGTGDDGTGRGGEAPDNGGDRTETVEYTYVIDLTFSANGRRRRVRGMRRLEMLPSQASPLLILLGVSPDAGDAVFLVDSTLQAAGEGRCKPSADECAFLHLGPGSEHAFTTDEGDSYTLRLDEIRKVRVGGSAAADRPTTEKRAEGRPAARARAAHAPSPVVRFAPPVLSDLVSVSSPRAGGVEPDRDRR
jgi:hypothetical protein